MKIICKPLVTVIFLVALVGVFTNRLFAQSDTASALSKIINDKTQNTKQEANTITFQKSINYPIASFAINNLGELYIINTNNQLKKFNERGDSIGVFNQVTKYGKLTYVDAQNPWKTILFYQNFSNIVLLDKYLNVLTNINLRKQNIFGVRTVASSYDNKIWLFDEQENKLKKIDDAGNVLMETVDFRQLFDAVPSPTIIEDHDGFVYLYDAKKGVYIFDYYGTFKNKIPFLNWKSIAVMGKNIYGFDDDYFYKYGIGSLDIKKYLLPAAFKNYTSLKVGANKIYFLKDDKLNVYSLQ